MQVLEELAAGGKLLCPRTREPVRRRQDRLVSPDGRDLGPARGPLNLLKTFDDTLEASQVPAAFVESVRTHLELPVVADPEIAVAIAASGARFDRSHLSAEARVLAERFGMPAFRFTEQSPEHAPAPAAAGARPAHSGSDEPPRLEHVRDYVGGRLVAGREVWRSVRVRNTGASTLAMADGAYLETRWSAADARELSHLARATELPADLEPGREITLILKLRAPEEPGRYELRVLAAAGGGNPSVLLSRSMQVTACETPVMEYQYSPKLLEYGPDHHAAAVELMAFITERYQGRRLKVLEIGGGVAPTGHSVAAHGHQVVSTDISHAQSILGALYFKHRMPQLDDSLAFVSCDGADLPFADGTFDAVMLVAALHHFAEPLAVLEESKRVTAPDGFVFLGCENCVPNPADPTYREELRRGINEQMWTLAEMTEIVRGAGLAVARAKVDYHSLKAALVKP